MAFDKNTIVNFHRNDSAKQNATVVAFNGNNMLNEKKVIVEYASGWNPDAIRTEKFSLDPTKKYLFVSETELTVAN